MINGGNNEVTVDAFSEVVFNGDGNTVLHLKYANGNRPIVADNSGDNTVEKIAAEPAAKE